MCKLIRKVGVEEVINHQQAACEDILSNAARMASFGLYYCKPGVICAYFVLMVRDGKSGAGQDQMFRLSGVPDDSVERACIDSGYLHVAGVDEAGRGPLAGPVVAAAVILPLPCPIDGLRDSKKLDPEKRDMLYDKIITSSMSYGVGISEPRLIDEVNILQATLVAMREAVAALSVKPHILLVDGISRVPMPLPQKLIKKGDGRCMSVAAASIVAKVTRDRVMMKLHAKFPQYGFASHFGYATRGHLEAIARNGPCDAHRRSFRGVKEYIGS